MTGLTTWILWLLIIGVSLSSQEALNADNVVCPDGRMECSEQMTCCQLQDTSYGCCPFPKATCCSDGLHCCPYETTCDIKHAMCRRKDGDFHSWVETGRPVNSTFDGATLEISSKAERENEVLPLEGAAVQGRISARKTECPGSNQTCADSYTCCKTPMGDYGCCPMIDAMCCEDHIHCCPKGSVCDTKSGRCSKQTVSFTSTNSRNNVICPGGEYQCPDRTTCCAMGGGEYGCCPLENASCCADLLHCCPEGYRCSVAGACLRSGGPDLPWLGALRPSTLPAIKLN